MRNVCLFEWMPVYYSDTSSSQALTQQTQSFLRADTPNKSIGGSRKFLSVTYLYCQTCVSEAKNILWLYFFFICTSVNQPPPLSYQVLHNPWLAA